jgi:hypothetical protein
MSAANLDNFAGQPVDLSPWAYAWRADRAVQAAPEACFIPRRLKRIDTVYRTALGALGPGGIKSYDYRQDDLLQPLLPAPKGVLTAGLLWVGGLSQYQVELHWPADLKDPPAPETVEVRVYPTAWGWFGWTVDKILTKPEISADRRTWIYRPEPGATMDWAYSTRVPAATEMVAVFTTLAPGAKPAVPIIRVNGPQLGTWKRMDIEIEWGFQAASAGEIQGRLETTTAVAAPLTVLPTDRGTTASGPDAWRSRQAGKGRRGITVPLVYAPEARSGLDSRITLWLKDATNQETGVTIRLSDLEKGPVLLPRHGLFVAKAGSGKTGKAFAADLAARNLKSVRQMVREHREAASWDEAFKEVRLWRCPQGTTVPPFAVTPEPVMQIHVPDERWVAMWRTATDQLRGPHMWGNLAAEVAPVAHAMELTGLHDHAAKIYDYFLASPGVKSDGDFADPKGSLEWAKHMRHDMAYSHEGSHCSTGRLLLSMMERYFLSGDRGWFDRNRARLQAAADWIIRERKAYMSDVPNRKDLHVAGLLPPSMMGDYALPASDWHWYYYDNAFALQGLSRFADVLGELDPAAGRIYRAEADAFRADLRRAVERDVELSPVRLGRDGVYHSFIPIRAYARGIMNSEMGAPQYNKALSWDLMISGLPLGIPSAFVLSPDDPRMSDTVDAMDERGTLTDGGMPGDLTVGGMPAGIRSPLALSADNIRKIKEKRQKQGLSADDAWYWQPYVDLPKWAFNQSIYLLQDDVPNFLRFFFNEAVSMVGSNGKLWEHWRLDSYAVCDNPDNGTSGWFLYNFRNLLVMEQDDVLWLARGTPRAWLEQGKRIAVKNAPTHFGTVAYEIISDTDHGQITATVDLPSRRTPGEVVLRFRHPKAAPIKSVTVSGPSTGSGQGPSAASTGSGRAGSGQGKKWEKFDAKKETITLKGLTGTVTVSARY